MRKAHIESDHVRLFGIGEDVRDWSCVDGDEVIYPYDASVAVTSEISIPGAITFLRSEEHTSELQSLMRISYAVFCLKKKTNAVNTNNISNITNDNIKTSLCSNQTK